MPFRKASTCDGGTCVEVGSFRKTSICIASDYSGCVEAGTGPGVVAVRDTTQAADPSRVMLSFTPDAWARFVVRLR